MGISVVPWIDERNALTVWVETSFFLFMVVQFGERQGELEERRREGLERGNLCACV